MKTIPLLFSLLLASSTCLLAQDLITFGVRGGLHYTGISGDYTFRYYAYEYYEYEYAKVDYSSSFKPGFSIGLDATYPLSDKMFLQAELFYSNKGYRGDWTYQYEGLNTGKFTDHYSFLSLPVFFKYNFTDHFYVMGGPQFSFLLSAKHKGEIVDTFGDRSNHTLDLMDRMNTLTVGVTPAVGYDLHKMSFSLRYYAGLTSMTKSSFDIDLKSQVLSLVVSYKVFSIAP